MVVAILCIAGCARPPKTAIAPPPAAAAGPVLPGASVPALNREFVDLEPGWRLHIIAPVTRSGSGKVEYETAKNAGNTITLKTTDDLIGYEDVIFAVAPRSASRNNAGAVRVKLESANLVREGKPEPIASPTRAFVRVPERSRFVRIHFLLRASLKDHEMAIASVDRKEKLEPLTARLRENPLEACVDRPREGTYCFWVTPGVAVRPELERTVDGVKKWVSRF